MLKCTKLIERGLSKGRHESKQKDLRLGGLRRSEQKCKIFLRLGETPALSADSLLQDVQSNRCPRCGQPIATLAFQGQGGYGALADDNENIPTMSAGELAPLVAGQSAPATPNALPPTFPTTPQAPPPYSYERPPSSALPGPPVIPPTPVPEECRFPLLQRPNATAI